MLAGQNFMLGTSLPSLAVPCLLDGIADVVCAFSFRRLLSSATNCARLHKSTPTTDYADVGFTPDGEWDQDAALAGLGSGVHWEMGTWYNQAPSATFDAGQATASARPRLRTSGGSLITIAGKAALEFNGSTTFLDMGKPNALDLAEYSIFIVWEAPAPLHSKQLFANWSAGASVFTELRHEARLLVVSGTPVMWCSDGHSSTIQSTARAADTPSLHTNIL